MNTRANAERSDTATELEHLQALVCEIESLAQRSLAERGEVVTLAWLRGIVHRVEHLETAWRNTLPSTPKTTPEQQPARYFSLHDGRVRTALLCCDLHDVANLSTHWLTPPLRRGRRAA
jgi:hypothetical protein